MKNYLKIELLSIAQHKKESIGEKMGLFSKKEKSPEEKLVNELVGSGFLGSDNLSNVLDSAVSQNELQKIVKKAWKNGASELEIQRVYDENLLRLEGSIENKEIEYVNFRLEDKQKSKNKHRIKNNLEKKNEILEKYPNIMELNQLLQTCMNLMGSNDIKNLAENKEKYQNIFVGKRFTKSTILDELITEFPSLNYAYTVLNKPKFFGDTITSFLYEHLVFLVFQILIYREKNNSYQDVYPLVHRIMVLLYDFDKEISYNEPDEAFFQALKEVKWDKDAEKFQDMIKDIYETSIIGTIGRSSFISFGQNHIHVLPFLGACNAVKNQRRTIEIEDVMVAFKTYFKFCDFKLTYDDVDETEVLDRDIDLAKVDTLGEKAIVPEAIESFLHKIELKPIDVFNLLQIIKMLLLLRKNLGESLVFMLGYIWQYSMKFSNLL